MALNGTIYTGTSLAGLQGLSHGFFTREGGVSDGDYRSLNCGYGSDDDRALVRENRHRVAAHLGARVPDLVTVHQVHSADAVIVTAPFATGDTPRADAIVTRTRGLAIGALTADCTPVLFAAPGAGVVGAAHAGWRGVVDGILQSTVATMETLGADRPDIRAVIGPTIHQPHYEVGPEFEVEFLTRSPANAQFFRRHTPDGKPHFDLPGFCRAQLLAAGVGNIENIGVCTYENESLLFSYRRKCHREEADYGRQISAIVLD